MTVFTDNIIFLVSGVQRLSHSGDTISISRNLTIASPSTFVSAVPITFSTSNASANLIQTIQPSDLATNPLGVRAQDAYAGAATNVLGGNLTLSSGLGTTAGNSGSVNIQTGGTTRLSVSPTNVTIPGIVSAAYLKTDGSGNITAGTSLAITNIAPGTSGQVLMSNATPATTWTTFSGDVTVSAAGATTVNSISGTAPVNVVNGSLSFGSNSATAGAIRLPNNTTIKGRNFANTADITIAVIDGSDELQFGDNTHAAAVIYNTTSGGRNYFYDGSHFNFELFAGNLLFGNNSTNYLISQTVQASNTTTNTGAAGFTTTITAQTGQVDGYVAGGTITGGVGGALNLNAGAGGAASGATTNNGGAGGNLVISSGAGGVGTQTTGAAGNVLIQAGGTTIVAVTPNQIQTKKGVQNNVTLTTTNTNYQVLVTDYLIKVVANTAVVTITLPASPSTGDTYIIKDAGATSFQFPITVSGNGNNIDGSPTYIMATNYAAMTLIYDSTLKWSVI